jgi:lysozyme
MKMSDKGLKLLTLREGSRKKAYQDTKGIWTIGVGHTGPEVVKGLVWSDQQILDQLRKDVAITEKCLDDNVVVLLGQDQVDALCSFIFNVGVNAFRRSTMLKFINKGMMKEAANEFDRWHIPPEITSRRNSEKSQFQGT